LKDPIVEHDVASVIKEAHKEKAPGLDGFVGCSLMCGGISLKRLHESS
jgi:hypothetical protein